MHVRRRSISVLVRVLAVMLGVVVAPLLLVRAALGSPASADALAGVSPETARSSLVNLSLGAFIWVTAGVVVVIVGLTVTRARSANRTGATTDSTGSR
jgi:hypothetical protein